ncbi:DUF3080 family protein [Pseudoalteromonas sp.]|uniref:DUF3080 family protein n=1 Tax=Pseudoalteromonas sp. TaxID=53249 RepID=UPI0023529956|nr:DUF3080 family protein [Pseudoalteromonas sp.]
MNHSLLSKLTIKHSLPAVMLLLVSAFVLVNCSKAPSSINNTYTARLSSTLNTSSITATPLEQLKLIKPTTVSEDKITVSIVELAGLTHCELNVLISEHNNQLGKTATAASQLKYQINFIQSADNCLNTLDDNTSTYKKINDAKNQKQTHLIHYFNSMLFKEPELNRTWLLTSNELSTHPAGFSDTVEALTQLVTIKKHIKSQQFSEIKTDSLFNALEQLNKYRFNQALIQSARQQIVLNNSATQFIKTISFDHICPTGKNKKEAKIMSNVFQKYYLTHIQPYQAQLTGYLEVLQPLYNQLWFEETVTSKQINNLLKKGSPNNLLNQLKNSAVDHVVWWQKFYKTCEINPI